MMTIFLKRGWFHLAESLINIANSVQTLRNQKADTDQAFLNTLEGKVVTLWKTWWTQSQELRTIDKTNDENAINDWIQNRWPEWQRELTQLIDALSLVENPSPLAECQLVQTSLDTLKLLPDSSFPATIAVLPQLSMYQPQIKPIPNFLADTVTLETINWDGVSNPLKWLSLGLGFFQQFSKKSQQLQSLLAEQNDITVESWMLAPILNLRLMGPAFYAYYVTQAFLTQPDETFWWIESTLFQGLNRFGFVNKDLVLLHQSIEKMKSQNPKNTKNRTIPNWNEQQREALLQTVEKMIPERLAFTEKSFFRSQRLEDRLQQGTLISAIPMVANPNQLYDELTSLLEYQNERQSVYAILEQVQETPASPREILTAAWLYILSESPQWVDQALEKPADEAWKYIKANVLNFQTLVIKSIETAQVFSNLVITSSPTKVATELNV